MLSALEIWINDKWYVGMIYMKQAEKYSVTAVKIVRSKSTYNVKFANNKDYKNTDQGTNRVPHCLLKVLG